MKLPVFGQPSLRFVSETYELRLVSFLIDNREMDEVDFIDANIEKIKGEINAYNNHLKQIKQNGLTKFRESKVEYKSLYKPKLNETWRLEDNDDHAIKSINRKLKELNAEFEFYEVKRKRISTNVKRFVKSSYKIHDKFHLLKELGILETLIKSYDQKTQIEILSILFECNRDTTRKLLSKTYTKGKDNINSNVLDLIRTIKNK